MQKLSDKNLQRMAIAAGLVANAAALLGYPGQGIAGGNWELRLIRISEELQDAIVDEELGEEGPIGGSAFIV